MPRLTLPPRLPAGEAANGIVNIPVTMHWVWSPLGLLIVLPVPALLLSMAISDDSFPELFGQPVFLTDTLRWIATCYLLIMLLAFLLIVPMKATSSGSIALDQRALVWLDRSCRVVATITFSAYVVWLGAAIIRGLRVDTIRALLEGDPGTMYTLRSHYFETIGGLTTWMQLAAIAAPLAILRSKAGIRSARPILAWLFVFAFVRALLNSERLALIEIVVSVTLSYLILRPEAPKILQRTLPTAALIVASWALLFLTFAGFEFFRSWTYAQSDAGADFWVYVSALLVGYYATALNLAAFDVQYLDGRHLVSRMFDGNIYDQLFGPSPLAGVQRAYGLETFTNRSGLITPYVAAGTIGGGVILLIVAVSIALLARRAANGHVVALLAYCASAAGILEIVRIFYFGSSRYLPIVVAAIVLMLSWTIGRSRAAKGHPRGASLRRKRPRLSPTSRYKTSDG